MPLSLHLGRSPLIFVSSSCRHPLLLKLGIMVGSLCCWFLMSMGTASAQSDLPDLPDPPTVSAPTAGGEESIVFQNIPSVYGAVKYEQKVTEAPASITIITADQIKKYGYRDFPQILASIPGFFTTNDRNYDYVGYADSIAQETTTAGFCCSSITIASTMPYLTKPPSATMGPLMWT